MIEPPSSFLLPRSPDHTNDQENLRVSARICLTLTVRRSRVRVLRAPHRHGPVSVVRTREAVTPGAVVSSFARRHTQRPGRDMSAMARTKNAAVLEQ